jgi:hypothetical protein
LQPCLDLAASLGLTLPDVILSAAAKQAAARS